MQVVLRTGWTVLLDQPNACTISGFFDSPGPVSFWGRHGGFDAFKQSSREWQILYLYMV